MSSDMIAPPNSISSRNCLVSHHGEKLAGSGSTLFVEGEFPGADFVVAHTTASGAVDRND